jgi:hypothetical protein
MNKLYVEGIEDERIILELLQNARFQPENYSIKRGGSRADVIKAIAAEVSLPENKTLGLIIDADESFEDAKKSILNRLKQYGYVLTNYTGKAFILTTNQTDLYVPKVGFWIMPDNQSKGCIEDFLLQSIPDNDVLMSITRKYFEEVIEKVPASQRFQAKETSKRLVMTYLIWRTSLKDETKFAYQKPKMLHIEAPLVQDFMEWMRALFD